MINLRYYKGDKLNSVFEGTFWNEILNLNYFARNLNIPLDSTLLKDEQENVYYLYGKTINRFKIYPVKLDIFPYADIARSIILKDGRIFIRDKELKQPWYINLLEKELDEVKNLF